MISPWRGKFAGRSWEAFAWWTIVLLVLLPSILVRFWIGSLPLVVYFITREAQTALTIQSFADSGVSWLRYPTSAGGELWNFTLELPVYQALCAWVISLTGMSTEHAARLTSLSSYLGAAVFLFDIVRTCADSRLARWTVLLFLSLPFGTSLSMACLPDSLALFLSLGAISFGLKFLRDEHALYAALFLLLGILASGAKSTIWGFEVPVFIAVTLLFATKRKRLRKKHATLTLLLLIQLIACATWTKYTQTLFPPETNRRNIDWLIGSPALRLDMEIWQGLASSLFRLILQDWLVPAFLVGISVCSRSLLGLTAILSLASSILVLFPIHFHHHYYFLISFPFLCVACASGLLWLLERKPNGFSLAIASLIAVLFTWRQNMERDSPDLETLT